MEAITKITVTEDVALVTLRNTPADLKFIASVFRIIAKKGVNVDMISQSAPLGGKINISFTVADESLGDILDVFALLREQNPEIKSDISGGNCKISLCGEPMREIPGVAAKVFQTIADMDVDIRIITTSEIDISVLIPKADYDCVCDAFEKTLGLTIMKG